MEPAVNLSRLFGLYPGLAGAAPFGAFDERSERRYWREQQGGVLGVPFFAEPLISRHTAVVNSSASSVPVYEEDGVHFYLNSNGLLMATSSAPCGFFCQYEFQQKD